MAKKDHSALWLVAGGIAAWFLLPSLSKDEEKSQLIPSLDISGILPNISGIDFGALMPNLGEMDFNKLIPDIGGMDFSKIIPDLSNLFGGGGAGGDGDGKGLIPPIVTDFTTGLGAIGSTIKQIVEGPRALYEGWMTFWHDIVYGPGTSRFEPVITEILETAKAQLSPEQFQLFQAHTAGEINTAEYQAALRALQASLVEASTGVAPETASIPESQIAPIPQEELTRYSEGQIGYFKRKWGVSGDTLAGILGYGSSAALGAAYERMYAAGEYGVSPVEGGKGTKAYRINYPAGAAPEKAWEGYATGYPMAAAMANLAAMGRSE